MDKPSIVDLCTAPSKAKAVFSGLLTGLFASANADQVVIPKAAEDVVWGISLAHVNLITALLAGTWTAICILRSIPWLWEKACSTVSWVVGILRRIVNALKE